VDIPDVGDRAAHASKEDEERHTAYERRAWKNKILVA
jgi:hypothetical protein